MNRMAFTLLLLSIIITPPPGVSIAQPPAKPSPAIPPAPPPEILPELTEQSLDRGVVEVLVFAPSARAADRMMQRSKNTINKSNESAAVSSAASDASVASTTSSTIVFDPSDHEGLSKQLLTSAYVTQLRKALYWQDTYHQRESKAHFDNCDFEESMEYIDELLRECDAHVAEALRQQSAGRKDAAEAAVRDAFFSLGQALHGIQDFYAHTNFVEMMKNDGRLLSQINPVPFWRAGGREQVRSLQGRGLVSGYVFWGHPKLCAGTVPSHSDLAKDSATTKEGMIIVPRWGNVTQYRAAYQLALNASREFLNYAFSRWAFLREKNGDATAFEVFQERRQF